MSCRLCQHGDEILPASAGLENSLRLLEPTSLALRLNRTHAGPVRHRSHNGTLVFPDSTSQRLVPPNKQPQQTNRGCQLVSATEYDGLVDVLRGYKKAKSLLIEFLEAPPH